MHATRKVKLKDISDNLTCNLCGGYFIDATTIVECIHSFCRSCIVQHLEKFDYCPVCEVQLHSSKPLSSIRSDQMLQEIVYKLVPGLFQNEMSKRRKFYSENPNCRPRTQQDGGQVFNESYITSDDMIHLSLEFDTTDKKLRENTKRFILCPAAVSIAILKKLIQGKYDLKNSSCIEIMYRERFLPDDFLLMDIAYKYSWSQNGNGPLQLYYRVIGVPSSTSPYRCKSLANIQPLSEKLNNTSGKIISKRDKGTEKDKKLLLKSLKTSLLSSANPITPSGKPRGRPKRKPSISMDDDAVEKPKKIKLDKPKKSPKKSKGSKSFKQEVETSSQGTEVQLRISENGVISAKSVSSGEERIINPISSPPKDSSPVRYNGSDHSPFSAENPTTNGALTPYDFTTFDREQDSPISLTKKNGIEENVKKSKVKTGCWPSPEKFESRKVETPPPVHMLKVPTPNKWLHSSVNSSAGDFSISDSSIVNSSTNGIERERANNTERERERPSHTERKIVPKPSPVKDCLGFTTNKISSPKKPPKFFKSRISETNNGTSNGHHLSSSSSSRDHSPRSSKSDSAQAQPKVTVSQSSNTPHSESYENGAGKFIPGFGSSRDKSYGSSEKPEKRNSEVSESLPIPSPVLQHHQFPAYGLLDDNMNMGSMGNMGNMSLPVPMQFMPSIANSYCYPFFPTPINPLLAMAMNMNQSFSNPYSPYANINPPALNPAHNGISNGNHKASKGNGNFLDLSMPSKKSKSSYVQISPKKSQTQIIKKAKKEKLEEIKETAAAPSPLKSTNSSSTSSPPKKLSPVSSVSKPNTPTKKLLISGQSEAKSKEAKQPLDVSRKQDGEAFQGSDGLQRNVDLPRTDQWQEAAKIRDGLERLQRHEHHKRLEEERLPRDDKHLDKGAEVLENDKRQEVQNLERLSETLESTPSVEKDAEAFTNGSDAPCSEAGIEAEKSSGNSNHALEMQLTDAHLDSDLRPSSPADRLEISESEVQAMGLECDAARSDMKMTCPVLVTEESSKGEEPRHDRPPTPSSKSPSTTLNNNNNILMNSDSAMSDPSSINLSNSSPTIQTTTSSA